jgi:hypothetical protein
MPLRCSIACWLLQLLLTLLSTQLQLLQLVILQLRD